MNIITKLICFFFILLAIPCSSQQLHFEQFTTKDGLPSNDVYSLLQDQKGYIWACTNYGIIKYNGTQFKQVCSNIPYNEQFAYCINENSKGEIWFGNSMANIYQVKNETAIQLKGIEPISEEMRKSVSEINGIFMDDSGALYILTKYHSYKFQNNKCVDLNKLYAKDSVSFVLLKNNNIIQPVNCVSSNTPVKNISFILNELGKNETKYSFKLTEPLVVSLRYIKKSGNDIYMINNNPLIKNKLLKYNNTLIKFSNKQSITIFPFEKVILAVNADPKGNIWIGCYNGGLYEMNSGGKILAHYFQNYTVNATLFDNQQGMWVSTSGYGLYHCDNINDSFYSNYDELSSSITLTKVIDSTLFIGTSVGHLYSLRKNILSKIALPENANLDICDIIPVSNGYIISSRSGLIKANNSLTAFTFLLNKEKAKIPAYALERDSPNGFYYINRTGIIKIKDDKSINVSALNSKITCLTRFTDSLLLIGTIDGLYTLNELNNHITYLENTKNISVSNFKKSATGKIVICTKGAGLFEMDTLKKITEIKGIPSRIINDAYITASQSIICANNGVFIKKNSSSPNWSQIYQEESNSVAMYEGKLFIGSNYGLIDFNVNELNHLSNPQFYLSKIKVGNSIYNDRKLEFTYKQNNLEFYFDFLNFRSPERNLYYSLSGKLNESNIVTGSMLHFNNMPPGNYELMVSPYMNSFGNVSKKIIVHFSILPAFWQTNGFILLMIILSMILMYCIIKIIFKRIKKREERKTELTRLLAEHKLTAIKAQINPHFISNSLAAIQQLVITDEIDKAGQYLAKFSLLIRYVLRYSDKQIVKLSEEINIIDLNIELEMLRFNHSFEFKKIIEDGIDPDQLFVPPLITQPFIENSIWHGLLPLKGSRNAVLILRAYKRNDELVISIEDNGVGRKKNNSARESKGITLIKNRLENINLVFGTNSSRMEIEDLVDPSSGTTGTRINIIIPYILSDENEYN